MPALRRIALLLTFGFLAACSGGADLTFRPVSSSDRSTLGWYLSAGATDIAEVRAKTGKTVVFDRETCSRLYDLCVYHIEVLDGARGNTLDTLIGKSLSLDGFGADGMPKLRVDGEPCVFISAPTAGHPNGEYINIDLAFGGGFREPPQPPQPAMTDVSPTAVSRFDLRARGATTPYRSAHYAILPNGATATVYTGRYDDQPFVLVAGNGSPTDRVLLSQTGHITPVSSKTHGAKDLVLKRFDASYYFRYDGTRYAPAPCQGADALRADIASPL